MKTVSREMAQKLKDAGWEKETYWIYVEIFDKLMGYCVWALVTEDDREEIYRNSKCLPAPTLDEVLEELPRGTVLYKAQDGYWAEAQGRTIIGSDIQSNPADAAAEVWLRGKPCLMHPSQRG